MGFLPQYTILNSRFSRQNARFSIFLNFRHTWKSRHNHFLRHSDVRPREDPRPTVNELANQKYIMQKINGWKIYHLTSQMEDIIDMEVLKSSSLNASLLETYAYEFNLINFLANIFPKYSKQEEES